MQLRYPSPSEILDKLCNETLNQRPSVLVYIEDEDSKSKPALIQYLLNVVEFIGIPVIVAVGESASLLQVSQLTWLTSCMSGCWVLTHIGHTFRWCQDSIGTTPYAMPGFKEWLRDTTCLRQLQYAVRRQTHLVSAVTLAMLPLTSIFPSYNAPWILNPVRQWT